MSTLTEPNERHEGNVIEWIALGGKSKVLLLTVSREVDIREREDEDEARFISAARVIFEKKGALVTTLCADELQSMWDDRFFDLIVLNGVLERQKRQHMSEDKVLSLLRRHLLPGGRVIAIEHNRLGIAYLSGIPMKKNFGLSAPTLQKEGGGYTRRRLERIFTESGFAQVNIYYPYENEYHTRAVFSDGWQPTASEEYIRTDARARLKLMEEERLMATLIEEGAYAPFANTFLVEAYAIPPAKQPPRLLYAKYTDDRKSMYNLRTGIYVYPSGERAVTKTPLSQEGMRHITVMQTVYESIAKYYKGYSLQFAPCVKMEEGVGFSFVKGEKLKYHVDREIISGNLRRAIWLIQKFADVVTSPEKLSILERRTQEIRFGDNGGFVNMFGPLSDYEEELLKGEVYLQYTDVDLNFDSVIIEGQTWTIYDYEWCVDFPVPFSYVLFRSLRRYFDDAKNRGIRDDRETYFIHFGITGEKQAVFTRMERAFLRFIGQKEERGVPAEDTYAYTLDDLIARLPEGGKFKGIEIRITYADGTVEEKLLPVEHFEENEKVYDVYQIALAGEAKSIRMQLSEGGGILSDVDIRDERGKSLSKQLAANANRSTGGRTYFFSPDAYLELTPKRNVRTINVRYLWTPLPKEALAPLKDLLKRG